jgi:hypothetical protein
MERGHQILEFVLPLEDVCCDLAVAAFLRGALMIGEQLLKVNQQAAPNCVRATLNADESLSPTPINDRCESRSFR